MAKKYAFGIDVGGTTVKTGLFSGEGKLLRSFEIPTDKTDNGANILSDIASAVKKCLKEEKTGLDEVIGIGMGLPGAVLDDGTVNRCINLGWGVFNAADKMSGLCGGVPVRCTNDANAAALGEMKAGGGRGYKNVFMVTLGTGVGGGLIIDGKIVNGAFGAAGEFGHYVVNKDETVICNCGKRGCLEQYTSANGIVRVAKKRLLEDDAPTILREASPLTSKAIFDAAKEGDKIALELADGLGQYLGLALSYVAGVADPEIFVIGGGVSKAGDILIDNIKKYYRKYAFHASRDTRFALAKLGNDAGMYGAAQLVL